MVGMVSCVVLVLLWANRSDDEETSLKLFSGAAPDKFSLDSRTATCWSGQDALRGGEHRSRTPPDKPYLGFSSNFFCIRPKTPSDFEISGPIPLDFLSVLDSVE